MFGKKVHRIFLAYHTCCFCESKTSWSSIVDENSGILFSKVDIIASGRSYKTLKFGNFTVLFSQSPRYIKSMKIWSGEKPHIRFPKFILQL